MEEAYVVVRYVVVASVVVEKRAKSLSIELDADTKMPIEEVGVRAKWDWELGAVSSHVWPNVTPWVIHADPEDCTTPWFVICTQLVAVFPRFEIVRFEVEARLSTRRADVEANAEIESHEVDANVEDA